MKLPIQLRVRTLMVLVTLVAAIMGGAIEWGNHRTRDEFAAHELELLRQVAWHRQQYIYCRDSQATHAPYPASGRQTLFSQKVKYYSLGSHTSWGSEASAHLYWADRIEAQSEGAEESKLKYQRRLLFP